MVGRRANRSRASSRRLPSQDHQIRPRDSVVEPFCIRDYCRVMRIAIVVLGVIVALFGLLWALQGFGVVGGSPMSNTTTWSVIGPIVVLVGIAIAVFGSRRRKP